jgi:hypothetical protein
VKKPRRIDKASSPYTKEKDTANMKSTKAMLLGILIALLGVGLAQPGNGDYIFRTFLFVPSETITVFFPVASILVILVGVIIGLVGYFRKS